MAIADATSSAPRKRVTRINEAQPKIAAKMLSDLAFLLNRLAHALHDEIVDRNGIDRRWLNSKRRFSNQQGIFAAGTPAMLTNLVGLARLVGQPSHINY